MMDVGGWSMAQTLGPLPFAFEPELQPQENGLDATRPALQALGYDTMEALTFQDQQEAPGFPDAFGRYTCASGGMPQHLQVKQEAPYLQLHQLHQQQHHCQQQQLQQQQEQQLQQQEKQNPWQQQRPVQWEQPQQQDSEDSAGAAAAPLSALLSVQQLPQEQQLELHRVLLLAAQARTAAIASAATNQGGELAGGRGPEKDPTASTRAAPRPRALLPDSQDGLVAELACHLVSSQPHSQGQGQGQGQGGCCLQDTRPGSLASELQSTTSSTRMGMDFDLAALHHSSAAPSWGSAGPGQTSSVACELAFSALRNSGAAVMMDDLGDLDTEGQGNARRSNRRRKAPLVFNVTPPRPAGKLTSMQRFRLRQKQMLTSMEQEVADKLAAVKLLTLENRELEEREKALNDMVSDCEGRMQLLHEERKRNHSPAAQPEGEAELVLAQRRRTLPFVRFKWQRMSLKDFDPLELRRIDPVQCISTWPGFRDSMAGLVSRIDAATEAAGPPDKEAEQALVAAMDHFIEYSYLINTVNPLLAVTAESLNCCTGVLEAPDIKHWAEVAQVLQVSPAQRTAISAGYLLYDKFRGRVLAERRALVDELLRGSGLPGLPGGPAAGVGPELVPRGPGDSVVEAMTANLRREQTVRSFVHFHVGAVLTYLQLAKAIVKSHPYTPNMQSLARVISDGL